MTFKYNRSKTATFWLSPYIKFLSPPSASRNSIVLPIEPAMRIIHPLLPILLLFLIISSATSHDDPHPHPDAGHSNSPPQCPEPNQGHNDEHQHPHEAHPIITSVCANTQYPDICISSAQSYAEHANIDGPPAVLGLLSHHIIDHTTSARKEATDAISKGGFVGRVAQVVDDCKKNYDDALSHLEAAKEAAFTKNSKQCAIDNFLAAINDYTKSQRDFMEMPGGQVFSEQCHQLEMMATNCIGVLEKM